MTITTRALYQGMSDRLVHADRMVPFANDDIAFATFDKLAQVEGLPPILTAPLTLEKAAEMANRLMAASADLAQSGFGPTDATIANIKTAMSYDAVDRANFVAQHLMQKEAGIEASSVSPVGQNTPTDNPGIVTKLDNKNRPPGMYENMQNQTALPSPGVIGREVTAAEKDATLKDWLAGMKTRMREGIANSGPAAFLAGLRAHHPEGGNIAAFAREQQGLAPGPAPQYSAEDLNFIRRWGQGAQVGNAVHQGAEAVGGAARATGSALATNPLTHMRAIRSGEGRGAAAAALAGQAALATGGAAGLGYGGMAAYDRLRGSGGDAPPPEQLDPEMLAALASKQASEKLSRAQQMKTASLFVRAMANRVGLPPSSRVKVAALGMSLCGPSGLAAMDGFLNKTAAEADDDLDEVLAVLQQQGIPVTPELMQALEAELANGDDGGGAAPGAPPAGPPMDDPGEQQKAAALQARLQKAAEGKSLLDAPQNTPTDQPGIVTQLDNKNRPPGKYENKGPNTELNTSAGEIGAEKKAQFLALAQTYGAQLPATASPAMRAEMIQKLASLGTDVERAAFVRSLFPSA